MKFLIITADDFGLHEAVNAAVEEAYLHGVLTSASLMVGAPAAADAVARAQHLPGLRVGLHVVVAEGAALLPSDQIPALTDAKGRLRADLVRLGFRLLGREARRQLEGEIRAQFSAFAATGLPLDHINVHKHLHVHPVVLALLVKVAAEFGAPPMRVPREPGRLFDANRWMMAPWIGRMSRSCRAAGLKCNDHLFGIADSGHMDEGRLLAVLKRLPDGVTEIYAHPAKSPHGLTQSMTDYEHAAEFQALLSERVRTAVSDSGAIRGGYRDVFSPPRSA